MDRRPSLLRDPLKTPARRPPKFCVLDLSRVPNLDASGTRGCFLQLAKLCDKRRITVCAAGITPRMDWMLRSHAASYDSEEEQRVKARMLSRTDRLQGSEKILLFVTAQEALEFCENALLHQLSTSRTKPQQAHIAGPLEQSLPSVLAQILDATNEEKRILERLEGERYHTEIELETGKRLFEKETHPDSFFVVLKGAIANTTGTPRTIYRQKKPILSGAGLVRRSEYGSRSNLFDENFQRLSESSDDNVVASLWSVGGVFGYVDFLSERPRHYRAITTQDGTRVAQFSHSNMNLLEQEDLELHALIQKVLLHASVTDLMNCTCDDV